jgi:biotin carboxyl carrier protein
MMPGIVREIRVTPGEEVPAGHPLLILEAMKMENEIRTQRAGRVAKIGAGPGDTVEGGAVLVELEPHPAPA